MKAIGLTLIIVSAVLTGCAVPKQQSKISLVSVFDKDQAERMMIEGTNSIKGSSLMRQVNGGVVSCAGQIVRLLPATPYAIERMRFIYGSDTSGTASAMSLQTNPEPFTNTDLDYQRIGKTTQCDTQGFFKFEKLSDGEFIVITRIFWKSNPNSAFYEGGGMMRKIKVQSGEVKEIVIAP